MYYIHMINNIVQTSICEIDPSFADIPIEERYAKDFLDQCIQNPNPVPSGWIYMQEQNTFVPPPESTPSSGTNMQQSIDLDAYKQMKLNDLANACQNVIHAGFDLETENGTEHFSLTAEDQINIQNLMMQVASGALAVPYHADNTPCRMFSAGEIMAVAEGAVRHKTYHTTYCNHLNVWIRRCEDAQELQDITYGAELPEDLAANMAALLGGAGA